MEHLLKPLSSRPTRSLWCAPRTSPCFCLSRPTSFPPPVSSELTAFRMKLVRASCASTVPPIWLRTATGTFAHRIFRPFAPRPSSPSCGDAQVHPVGPCTPRRVVSAGRIRRACVCRAKHRPLTVKSTSLASVSRISRTLSNTEHSLRMFLVPLVHTLFRAVGHQSQSDSFPNPPRSTQISSDQFATVVATHSLTQVSIPLVHKVARDGCEEFPPILLLKPTRIGAHTHLSSSITQKQDLAGWSKVRRTS